MSTCPFSKFRDIFGKPGEGVHLVDYFLTIVLAFFITAVTGWPLVLTTIGALVAGIILHMLFGVNTQSVNALGLTC